jgi:hypothetical protein
LTRGAVPNTVEDVRSKGRTVTPIDYEPRVLAYVDVLGWRELIKRSVSGPSVRVTIAKAVGALRSHRQRVRRFKGRASRAGIKRLAPEVTIFSDTVAISCVPDAFAVETIVGQVQSFCTELMLAGVYARGAIVQGLLHHRGGVIIGPALVEAHDIESTVAKYPRIVVANDLVPSSFYPAQAGTVRVPLGSVIRDHDLLGVLNPFSQPYGPFPDAFIEHFRRRVQRDLLRKNGDLGIRAKLGWLLTFMQRVLDSNASRVTEQSKSPG